MLYLELGSVLLNLELGNFLLYLELGLLLNLELGSFLLNLELGLRGLEMSPHSETWVTTLWPSFRLTLTIGVVASL